MRENSRRVTCGAQDGVILIEVLASAILILIAAAGTFAAVQSYTRASGEESNRARAHNVAQADQARLRSLNITQLSSLNETRIVSKDGSNFTVDSSTGWISDETGTVSCDEGTAAADYLQVTTEVTWGSIGAGAPVRLQSIVAPPHGASSPDRGALAIKVLDGDDVGMAGVAISGSGAGGFSGSTNADGCLLVGNLPVGNYTLSPSVSGGVDRDGNPPGQQEASVVGQATNVIVLQFAQPGAIDVDFTVREQDDDLVPTQGDSIVVSNTGMTTPNAYGTIGSPATTITATPLFPFSSPDVVYAGSCQLHNPDPSGSMNPPPPSIAAAQVQSGGTASATVQMPALHVTIDPSGYSLSMFTGRDFEVTDDNCDEGGQGPHRTYTMDSSGELPNIALPTSTYDVCANGRTSGGSNFRLTENNVEVSELSATGTPLTLSIADDFSWGACP